MVELKYDWNPTKYDPYEIVLALLDSFIILLLICVIYSLLNKNARIIVKHILFNFLEFEFDPFWLSSWFEVVLTPRLKWFWWFWLHPNFNGLPTYLLEENQALRSSECFGFVYFITFKVFMHNWIVLGPTFSEG